MKNTVLLLSLNTFLVTIFVSFVSFGPIFSKCSKWS